MPGSAVSSRVYRYRAWIADAEELGGDVLKIQKGKSQKLKVSGTEKINIGPLWERKAVESPSARFDNFLKVVKSIQNITLHQSRHTSSSSVVSQSFARAFSEARWVTGLSISTVDSSFVNAITSTFLPT